MKKTIIASIIIVLVIIVASTILFMRLSSSDKPKTVSDGKAEKVLIGFSLGTLKEERWQKDADFFTKRAEELGAIVDVKYSGEDSNLQISQAENLIIEGAKALVVVPYDGVAAAAIVEKAHAAGVKVIAYDRMITKSDVDLYLTFDGRTLGQLQAEEVVKKAPKGIFAYIGGSPTDNNAYLLKEGTMKVLDPSIKKGDIHIAVDTFSKDWNPEEAYKAVKQYLLSGKKLDAVVAANDSTASGAIRALKEFNLAGKVPVSGQDAEITACQRVAAGTQTMTIYKPLKDLAYKAAEEAISFARGESPSVNGSINNGKIDVASYFLTPIVVTKENMDKVIIESGFHTHDEIYPKK